MARPPESPTPDVSFRPLDLTDTAAVARIWNDTYAGTLPADPDVVLQILASVNGDPDLQWLALRAGEPIGFAWGRDDRASWSRPGIGYVSAIAVTRGMQGRGVGSALYGAVAGELRRRGCATIRLGSDADHLLPGVPLAAPARAWSFFLGHGAVPGVAEFDLHLDLRSELRAIPLPAGMEVVQDAEAAVAFAGRAFPGRWHDEAARYAEVGIPLLALVEADRGAGAAVGFCAVFPPDVEWVGPSLIWRRALSERAAGLGPIGIDQSARGRGLGLAFTAEACRWLRKRGAAEVVVNWTTLTAFYGRLGARVWRAYQRVEVPPEPGHDK